MADNPKEAKARAEVKFAKAQKAAQEGATAKAQYDAEARAVREKTSRLRATRLARDAAAAETQPIRKSGARNKKPSA